MRCQSLRKVLEHSIFPKQARRRNVVVTDEKGHAPQIREVHSCLIRKCADKLYVGLSALEVSIL